MKYKYKDIKMPFVIRWCKLNNQLDWLTKRLDDYIPCKQIVYEFCTDFMPDLLPKELRDNKPIFEDETEEERLSMMCFGDTEYHDKVREWLK